MAASVAISSVREVQAFVDEYFEAWRNSNIEQIMGYYSDDVQLAFAGAPMDGKDAVKQHFVEPVVTGFPGNRHVVQNLIFGENAVVVEWNFEAEHTGSFAGQPPSGKSVKVPGCSVYEYDPARRKITGGRIYLDVTTLLKQIGAA